MGIHEWSTGRRDSRPGCWLIAGALALALAIWCGQSALEAAAYNRATGANVSMFDAMFIELRVVAPGR